MSWQVQRSGVSAPRAGPLRWRPCAAWDGLRPLLDGGVGAGGEQLVLIRRRRRLVAVLLVEAAILHDVVQLVVVLQDGDVVQGVAVDEDQVGEVAGLDLTELVGAEHDLPAEGGGGQDGFHRGEAEPLDEVLQVASVSAMRSPGEAVVAAGQDADAAAVHLAQPGLGHLQFLLYPTASAASWGNPKASAS